MIRIQTLDHFSVQVQQALGIHGIPAGNTGMEIQHITITRLGSGGAEFTPDPVMGMLAHQIGHGLPAGGWGRVVFLVAALDGLKAGDVEKGDNRKFFQQFAGFLNSFSNFGHCEHLRDYLIIFGVEIQMLLR